MRKPLQTTWLNEKPPSCPVCVIRLDGAIGEGVPEPETLTLCISCGVFLVFTPEMQLRVLSDEDWAHLDAETRDQLSKYLDMTKAFRSREA